MQHVSISLLYKKCPLRRVLLGINENIGCNPSPKRGVEVLQGRDFLKQNRVYLPEKSTRIFEKPEERQNGISFTIGCKVSLFKARKFDVLRISLLP